MKHIKLFETAAERADADLATPYLVYIKETETFESLDEQAVERRLNPELMALCYSKGWCEREDYMTAEEAAAVSDAQFDTLTAASLKNVKSLEELRHFTGLKKIPRIGLFADLQTEVVHFPNSMVEGYMTTGSGNNLFLRCTKLRKVVFPDDLVAWSGTGASYKTLFTNASSLKYLDLSNTKINQFGGNTFGGTNVLKGVILPSTLSTIAGSWYTGPALTWVKLLRPTPVTGLRGTSNKVIGANTRVYVPDESVNAYKTYSELTAIAANIYPISQWQVDINNGVIQFDYSV